MAYHTGITKKVRQCIREMNGRFRASDVIDGLGSEVQTYSARNRVKKVILDMAKAGEILRLERGLYEYRGKQGKPQLREVMWRILRARRSVTVDDLVELSGAKEGYALEWLQMLARNGIVRHLKTGRWQMISDPVDMPDDGKKADRLKNLRINKKAALAAIALATGALQDARVVIEQMEDA